MKIARILCISLVLFAVLPSSGIAQESDRQRAFRFENEDLRAALDSLMRWYGISIVYYDSDVTGVRVTSRCSSCSVVDALGQLLNGTGLMWIRMGNQFILRQRPAEPARATAAVNGVLSDSLTGGWIAGATILLQKDEKDSTRGVVRWCPTNSFGFYSLPDVETGEYVLAVRAIGYAGMRQSLHISGQGTVRADISLRQEDIPMQEFTVEGHRTESTPAGGLVRGTYIRSVPSDQTQYLLDGARIYNPSHFGGVLTTFQPDVLNDVESAVNGLSPYYGGRIGGLLDLSVREGTKERVSGTAGAGSLGAHLLIEGPLSEKSTFLISGRRAYVDPAVPFLEPDAAMSRSGSYEVIGKVNYRLATSSRLFLSGYLGRDTYENSAEGGGGRLDNSFSWANRNLQCRWFGISSSSLFLYGSVAYSRYDLTLDHSLNDQTGQPSTVLSSDYRIEDFSMRAHAEHYLDRDHTVRGGVELIGHGISAAISTFSLSNAPFTLQGFSSWELAVYVQDQWRIAGGVTAELGARVTSFMGSSGSRSGVDPRFSILAALDDNTRLFASMTAINQFIHPYRTTGVFFFYPTVFWYPSTDVVKPTTSLQITAGIERAWASEACVASVEAYYRTTRDYHGFNVLPADSGSTSLMRSILYGAERAYGGSIAVRKRFGVLTGSLRYTLSWLSDTFAELNNGDSFAPAFDRRHEVELWVNYSPGEEWAVGCVCELASEPRLTTGALPEARVLNGSKGPAFEAQFANALDANGSRSPGFQRLEINIMKRLTPWGVPCQLTLRMMNAYGMLDPYAWTVNPGQDMRRKWTVTMRDLKLFPLYPAVGLNVRF